MPFEFMDEAIAEFVVGGALLQFRELVSTYGVTPPIYAVLQGVMMVRMPSRYGR
jgi:hypothetical protein